MMKYNGPLLMVKENLPGNLCRWYHYDKGDDVPEHHVPLVMKQLKLRYPALYQKYNDLSSDAKEKLAEVKKDLADDGKLNNSHDPKKKSPGRPKKRKKKE